MQKNNCLNIPSKLGIDWDFLDLLRISKQKLTHHCKAIILQ